MGNFNNDLNSIHSARQLAEIEEEMKREKVRQEAEEIKKERRQNAPIIEKLERLTEQTQQQNILLQEENERQQEQLRIAAQNEKLAKKEARRSKLFAIITFCVATAISIASLIVAIVK